MGLVGLCGFTESKKGTKVEMELSHHPPPHALEAISTKVHQGGPVEFRFDGGSVSAGVKLAATVTASSSARPLGGQTGQRLPLKLGAQVDWGADFAALRRQRQQARSPQDDGQPPRDGDEDLAIAIAASLASSPPPPLEQLMREADPAQLEHLLALKEEKGMSELIFAQALQLLPRRAAGGADDGQPSVEALMAEADPEQLKYLLLAKEAQGMSDLVFRQALQLLPTQGDAARKGGQASAASVGVGLDVEGEAESVPPGMTAAERTAWEDDGFFWRRGCFTADQMRAAKAEIRPACEAGAAPMGMVTGPGARVFFADDPTAPSSIPALATDPAAVLGPLREIVGDDVDFLYTKAVWKDATTITGFGWHWDHSYWGGAPKISTWLALDDANESNGCLKLVAGSHKLVPQLLERFAPSFQRTRENDEDPWLQKSGAPPTRGDDFIIDEPRLDAFLAEHRLSRTTEPARAGDVLFFSSLALHASFHNTSGCADRWALISTYRDAATPDTSKVFPKPRPVLRRGCATLGLKAHVEHPTSEEELAARYIKPGVHPGLG